MYPETVFGSQVTVIGPAITEGALQVLPPSGDETSVAKRAQVAEVQFADE